MLGQKVNIISFSTVICPIAKYKYLSHCQTLHGSVLRCAIYRCMMLLCYNHLFHCFYGQIYPRFKITFSLLLRATLSPFHMWPTHLSHSTSLCSPSNGNTASQIGFKGKKHVQGHMFKYGCKNVIFIEPHIPYLDDRHAPSFSPQVCMYGYGHSICQKVKNPGEKRLLSFMHNLPPSDDNEDKC